MWSTHKETLDDLIEAENAEETEDSWAQILKKIAEKRSQLEVKEREKMGRGARRKTAGIKVFFPPSYLRLELMILPCIELLHWGQPRKVAKS